MHRLVALYRVSVGLPEDGPHLTTTLKAFADGIQQEDPFEDRDRHCSSILTSYVCPLARGF